MKLFPRSPSLRVAARIFLLLCPFTGAAQGFSAAAPAAAPAHRLMPVPAMIAFKEGQFRVNEFFSIGGPGPAGSRTAKAASRFMERLAARTSLSFRQDYSTAIGVPENSAFVFTFDRTGELRPGEDEAYSVTIGPVRIMLTAPTDLGVLRGFETVLQLVEADPEGYYLPCVQIDDRPRFTWRGLLLDVCSHFFPVDIIKRNLDAMAAVKLNVFHWHLTEDQGFRVESRVFPELHTMGSGGLYYTQAEIRDVIRYAADRGIRVMPEFDLPGHSTSWFVSHPEFASAPGPYRIETKFGVLDPVFNPANSDIYPFLEKFLQEMAGLFPDPYVHIGGDENNGRQWDANPEIQRFKEENNLADNGALQAYFNRRIQQILARSGKIMAGWDEILQPTLPRDIVIQSWRGRESMTDSAEKGFPSLLSFGYYIDLCQTAEYHYLNDPLPPSSPLSDEKKKLILGGEATMWTELVSPENVDSRIWPRTAAIAERLWSPEGLRDVPDMYRRLDAISLDLEDLGLTHIKNKDAMLRRLAGGTDIGPLRTLVDALKPLEGYARHKYLLYTRLTPLTRAVDAADPESRTARIFRGEVEAFLARKDSAAAERVDARLGLWRGNHAALLPLLRSVPALRELLTLSRCLSDAGEIGLQAVRTIRGGAPAGQKWADDQMKRLSAGDPGTGAELAVIGAVEMLVRAAAQNNPAMGNLGDRVPLGGER